MKDQTIIIIALVIVTVIVMPSLFAGFGNLFKEVGEWVKYGYDDQYNKLNDESKGESYGYIGFEIHYTDGSVEINNAETFSLFPLTIMHSGKELSFVILRIYSTLSYSGTITSSTANIRFYAHLKGHATTGYVFDIDESPLVSFDSGVEKNLRDVRVEASDLDSACSGLGSGSYTLVITAVVTIDATFSTGETEQATYQTESEWVFSYSSAGISSLSLRIHTMPYY